MSRRGAGHRPAPDPANVWVVADRPDSLARLLQAVGHADMVPTVVTHAAVGQWRDPELAPRVVLIDASALAPSASETMERLHRAVPEAALLVVADERPIRWLTIGATAVLPPPTSTTAIALQLRRLTELHPAQPPEDERRYGPFVHDPGRASLRAAGAEVRCSPSLVLLLRCLIQASGAVVTLDELRRALQRATAGDAADVRTQVRRLRRCLDDTVPGLGASVVTVRGIGYRLDRERALSACRSRSSERGGDKAAPTAEGGDGRSA